MERKGAEAVGIVTLSPWTRRRGQELLQLLDRFGPSINQLSQAIKQEAEQRPEVPLLMTHPGVGSITALAYVLVIGTPDRFRCGKQVGSYLGLIPCNALLRSLLEQAAQSAARCDAESRRQYVHLAMRRNRAIAKVAMGRKLAVRLFWMWRKEWDYQQLKESGSHVA